MTQDLYKLLRKIYWYTLNKLFSKLSLRIVFIIVNSKFMIVNARSFRCDFNVQCLLRRGLLLTNNLWNSYRGKSLPRCATSVIFFSQIQSFDITLLLTHLQIKHSLELTNMSPFYTKHGLRYLSYIKYDTVID